MADLTFPKELIERLEAIARQEKRTPTEVLSTLLDQYPTQPPPVLPQSDSDEEAEVRKVVLRVYERARRYWREHGETEKANMTDAEMDQHFWLIDHEGIPRLKSEQGEVELPPGSAYKYVQNLEQNDGFFYSGRSDVAERSLEILEKEYGDYLLNRMRDSEDNG